MVRLITADGKAALKTLARKDVLLPFASRLRVIFVFHDLSDRGASHHSPLYSTPPDVFEQQLEWLSRRFDMVRLDEVLDPTRRSDGRPMAAVTFDDGFRSVREVAHPLLQAQGIPYTVFLIGSALQHSRMWITQFEMHRENIDLHDIWTRYCRTSVDESEFRRDPIEALVNRTTHAEQLHEMGEQWPAAKGVFLDQDDVVAMASEGVEFGNHTFHHPNLSLCNDETLAREIDGGHSVLTDLLEGPVRYMAPPFGKPRHFDVRTVRHCAGLGYSAVLANGPRFFATSELHEHHGPLVMPRVTLTDQIGSDLVYLVNLALLRTLRRTSPTG